MRTAGRDVVEILVVMVAGVLVGATVFPARLKGLNEKLTLAATGLLIFSMGVLLAGRESFLEELGTVGWASVLFCLVPVAVTGGIHLDGYADTSDALSSYGDREKKLEILKDSHCGAFAVIRLCCYFVAYFGLCGSVRFTPRVGALWALALVGERALSGFAVAAFPLAKDTGLAHTFATAADKQTVRRFLCGLSALLILALTALGGGGLAAAALLALWRYDFVAKKQFGGITGDLAGWFLQRAELWMLAALAVSQWGGVL